MTCSIPFARLDKVFAHVTSLRTAERNRFAYVLFSNVTRRLIPISRLDFASRASHTSFWYLPWSTNDEVIERGGMRGRMREIYLYDSNAAKQIVWTKKIYEHISTKLCS